MGNIEKLHNYTYLLEYSDGMLYHGVRSCDCAIKDDLYYGSSNYTPDEIPKKTILTEHLTRELAAEEEIRYQAEFDVKCNDLYYNKVNQTSTGFDTTGIPRSPEDRQKISDAMKGVPKTPEAIQKMSEAKKGKKQSPETKKKMSDAKKGKKASPEARKRMSDAKKGKTNRAKEYISTDPQGNENLITNLAEFCRENGLHQGHLSQVATGKLKQHKGYKARYAN